MSDEIQRNADLTATLLTFEQGPSRYRTVLERSRLPIDYAAMNADLTNEIMQAAHVSC